jgi:uncharacterized protein (TIGR02391 family)
MARNILDPKLKEKIAKKLGLTDTKLVNVRVSKKAGKLGISPEAAQILLAKELGIGTAIFQRKLDPSKQAEVREALPAILATEIKEAPRSISTIKKGPRPIQKKAFLKTLIEYLIQDQEVRERCGDILLAKGKFDRPINQATQILEDRIRNKSQAPNNLVGVWLVDYAFIENIDQTVLRVASNDPHDQQGFSKILRGIVPAFRNKTHHRLIDTFTREEAIRICGFIDVLLRVVDNSTKER